MATTDITPSTTRSTTSRSSVKTEDNIYTRPRAAKATASSMSS